MDDTSTSVPASVTRPIRRPFFLVHTPDRIGNYFQKDLLRIVANPRERLTAYLAPAKLSENGTDNRGKALQEAVYDLSAFQRDAAQMEYLPASLVADFEAAAGEFLNNPRATDFELKLRQGFRLPDPDTDPQAYVVYGPPEDRRLAILWGVEDKENSALPLAPFRGYEGPTIVEKLKSRIMGAQARRLEALKLLDRSQHPLARFMATEVRGGDGRLRELVSKGRRIPAPPAKKLKHLSKTEIKAFADAARQYCEEAYPDASGISAYEKELRIALRLPSLQKSAKSYYIAGGKLLIVNSSSDDYESCVAPVPDSVLGLPVPKTDAEGRTIIDPTAAEQLEARATPVKLYASLAAAGILLVGALAGLGIALLDTDPPAIVAEGRTDAILTTRATGPDSHEDTPKNIRILWTEKLDPASIRIVSGQESTNSFVLTGDIIPVEISGWTLSQDGKTLDLALASPMKDGATYRLTIRNVADTSLRHNAIVPDLTKSFDYKDTVPPTVARREGGAWDVGAEGADSRKLKIRFDELLNKDSAENPSNYRIDGYLAKNAVYNAADNSVTVTFEKLNAAGIDKGFVNKGNYTLTVDRGIRDASVSGNFHRDSYEVPFIYEDVVPPTIAKARWDSQIQVSVTFGEPIDPASVSASNFKMVVMKTAVSGGEDGEVEITRAEVSSDKYTVRLATSPMHRNKYRVSATGIADLVGNKIASDAPATGEFIFDGVEDVNPPTINSGRSTDGVHVELTFSKPLDKKTVIPGAFAVYSDLREGAIPVSAVELSERDASKVTLTLNVTAVPGERIYVVATKLADMVGNVADYAKSQQFQLRSNPTPSSDLTALSCRLLPGSKDQIEIIFNGELDPDTAMQPFHYYYSGAASVDKVTLATAGKSDTVRLHLSKPVAELGQTVIASGLSFKDDTNHLQTQVVMTLRP
jgi:hypothetical protein